MPRCDENGSGIKMTGDNDSNKIMDDEDADDDEVDSADEALCEMLGIPSIATIRLDADDDEVDSADEALCEMLGIPSIGTIRLEKDEDEEEKKNGDDFQGGKNGCSSENHHHRNNKDDHHTWNHNNDDYSSVVVTPTTTTTKNGQTTTTTTQSLLQRFFSSTPISTIRSTILRLQLREEYKENAICVLPEELSIPAHIMRRLTEELVWGGDEIRADKTHETIQILKKKKKKKKTSTNTKKKTRTTTAENQNGNHVHNNHERSESSSVDHDDDDESSSSSSSSTIIVEEHRRTLTRLENFVNFHGGWYELCHDYIRTCISSLMGEEMVLFKEKLNLKPPGRKGFAPHLDAPSLRVAFSSSSSSSSSSSTEEQKNKEEEEEEEEEKEKEEKEATNTTPKTFVTVMVAIDDMTAKNGCLRVAKGPWEESNALNVIEPDRDGNPDSTGRAGALPQDVADGLRWDDVVVKGGTIAAFDGWIPHRSGTNGSYFSRRAVFLTYNPLREGNHHERYYKQMEQLRQAWKESVGLARCSEDEKADRQALSTIPK